MLCTPTQITDYAHKVCSGISVVPDSKQDLVTLVMPQELTLPNGGRVTLHTAVSGKDFVSAIQKLIRSQITPDDASKCLATRTPLCWPESSGYTAARSQYAREHDSCSEAIRVYLNNPDDQALKALSTLGLDPDHVQSFHEEDLGYFRAIRTWNLPKDRKEFFARIYHSVYEVLKKSFLQQEKARLQKLEQIDSAITDAIETKLAARVIGQEEAIKAAAAALIHADEQKNKTFLFVGPTGVGKTELAEAIGDLLGKERFVKFDMTNFLTENMAGNFIGAGAGFVGSQDLPDFAKCILATIGETFKPQSSVSESKTYEIQQIAVLLDEFGKAHHTVRMTLLNLFDKGSFTASYTKGDLNIRVTLKFKNCIFITTSTLFQDVIAKCYSQNMPVDKIVGRFREANQKAVCEGNARYGGEIPLPRDMMGRMQIIPFKPIPKGLTGYQTIIDMQLKPWLDGVNATFQKSMSGQCGNIVIEGEKRLELLQILEAGLYNDGTDIRKIGHFLTTVESRLVTNKRLKTDENVQISIFGEKHTIYAQRYIIDDFTSERESYGAAIPLYSFDK